VSASVARRRSGRPVTPNTSISAVSTAVPGRVRLRVADLRGQHVLASRFVDRMSGDLGVHDVRANAVTGSILIRFDPHHLDTRTLIVTVRRYLGDLRNGHERRRHDDSSWHTLTAADVIQRLSTSQELGLSSQDAHTRLVALGANRLPMPQPKSSVEIIAGHVTSLPVLLLGGAAVLSLASGALIDAIAILAVVAANATVGYFTERRVERILTSLQSSAVPCALIRRDGKEMTLPAPALVPGDVLILKPGDDVPADARIVEAQGLAVNESALTGESVAVAKSSAVLSTVRAALADRVNMVYTGTAVAEGSGEAVVTATGRDTEVGRIRALVAETSMPATRLERQLDDAGRRLVGLSLGACAAALALGVLRGVPVLEMARSAISLAVAAVPEGLPAVATTTLALGMERMMRHGILVRRLAAVESLGETTVICADKTGTLTENRMTVDSWWVGSREYGQGPELGAELEADMSLARLVTIAVLCNEAELAADESDGSGSSTESALLVAAREAGIDYRVERQRYRRCGIRRRIDRDNWMATVHDAPGPSSLVAVKGAPEQVIRLAEWWLDNGTERPLTPEARRELLGLNDRIAARGLRVLALAFKQTSEAKPSYGGLIWAGLVALTDPMRPGVGAAIRACRSAGIRTVLITGDHARTASAIYRELGLENGRPRVFDVSHVDELSPETLSRLVREVDVFARVSPADKYRIVQALQTSGEVVAMTGDGHNDVAALRAADIGVAMGIRGTDIARDVADVVLAADDFGGIVAAVEQGRTIHANIDKSLRFLLATNFSEILVTLGALSLGAPRPMSAIQFLWINLLSDVAPALALAQEPAESDVMERPPRDPAAPMLSRSALADIGRDAGVLAAATLGVHGLALARYGAGPRATTLAFSTLTTAQLLHALTYRSRAGDGSRTVVNPLLLGVVGGSVGAQIAAMAFAPLRRLLGVTPLTAFDWVLVAGGAVLPLIFNEIRSRRGPAGMIKPTANKGESHGDTKDSGAGASRSPGGE
jgi:P-type Ca2+ transporter type 2C